MDDTQSNLETSTPFLRHWSSRDQTHKERRGPCCFLDKGITVYQNLSLKYFVGNLNCYIFVIEMPCIEVGVQRFVVHSVEQIFL